MEYFSDGIPRDLDLLDYCTLPETEGDIKDSSPEKAEGNT